MDKIDEKLFPFMTKRKRHHNGIDDSNDKKSLEMLVSRYDMENILEELCQMCEDIAFSGDCDEARFHQWNLRKIELDKFLRKFPTLKN